MKTILLVAILISQSAFAQMVGTSEEAPEQDYCEFITSIKELHLFKRAKNLNQFVVDIREPADRTVKNCTKEIAKEFLYESSLIFKQPYLDDLETLMINMYVGTGFTFLNSLAKFKDPPVGKKLIEVMDRGLSKLPDHEGIVYSGNPNNLTEDFKPGMVIKFSGYLSTSLNKSVSEVFMRIKGNRGVLFKLHIKTGKDLSQTFNTTEKEVLVPRGSRFKVIAISNDGADRVIEMEQLLK